MARGRRRHAGRPGGRPQPEGLVPAGPRGMPRGQQRALTPSQKQALVRSIRALDGAARSFVSEVFRRAREARGRLDDDVYGILQATMEALAANRGLPPPLVFGVTHYQTNRVEHIRFMPTGVDRIPPGARGRLVSNHPAFLQGQQRGLPPTRGGNRAQLED